LASEAEISRVSERLKQPLTDEFFPLLFVVEGFDGQVSAFCSVLMFPPLKLAHIEYIRTAPNRPGGGLGGLLYERVRDECKALGFGASMLECLPDEPWCQSR
jgi:hypothetical protein